MNRNSPEKILCKVYNDGGHYIATPYFSNECRRAERKPFELQELREMFESLYAYTITAEMKRADTLEFLRGYILKYIGKTGEKITYSRGIRGGIWKEIAEKDIVCEMRDFVLKYILFDNVIDWERDIMHFKQEQMTFADISPHWLC